MQGTSGRPREVRNSTAAAEETEVETETEIATETEIETETEIATETEREDEIDTDGVTIATETDTDI